MCVLEKESKAIVELRDTEFVPGEVRFCSGNMILPRSCAARLSWIYNREDITIKEDKSTEKA